MDKVALALGAAIVVSFVVLIIVNETLSVRYRRHDNVRLSGTPRYVTPTSSARECREVARRTMAWPGASYNRPTGACRVMDEFHIAVPGSRSANDTSYIMEEY